MGDHADDYLDSSLDEYWPYVDPDDEGTEYIMSRVSTSRRPPTKTCKYCGENNLMWGLYYEDWRLFNSDGDLHRCLVYGDHIVD